MSNFQVPRTFTVPETINGVQGLLLARGWEKAAIVYAYTKPEPGKRTDLSEKPDRFPCTYKEFASLGLTGLRDQETVAFYRAQWVKGIEDGWAEMVGPGDTIDVPAMRFPSSEPRSGTGVRNNRITERTVAEAIVADPEIADAAWAALQEVQAEKRENYIKDRHRAGVPPSPRPVGPAWQDSPVDNATSYAVEESSRRERIRELTALAEQGRTLMQQLASECEHTGVADEVELVHRMTAALTDWQWCAASFTVEKAGESR